MAHRVIFRCDAEFGRSRGISDLPEITACSTRRERAKAGNRVSFGVIHGSSAEPSSNAGSAKQSI
jgi:hypothetical protein